MFTLLIRLQLVQAWTAPACSESLTKIQKRMRYYHEEKGIDYDSMLVLDQTGSRIDIDINSLPEYIGTSIPTQTRKTIVKKDLFDDIPD
jgi:hypothetical protein